MRSTLPSRARVRILPAVLDCPPTWVPSGVTSRGPLYLISQEPDQWLADHRDSAWAGGCDRCRAAMITACERVGFSLRIAYLRKHPQGLELQLP